MLNAQPVEKGIDHHLLDVVDIWQTIQGEGPFVGWPAIFIRLAGCNLQCPLCDTDYTTGRSPLPVASIMELVELRKEERTKLIVLTGGEPFRQNICTLVSELTNRNYRVQIETNGTISPKAFGYMPSIANIVCSPKTPKIDHDILQDAMAFKYVVQAGQVDLDDGLPTSVLGLKVSPARPYNLGARVAMGSVYVQPADEYNDIKNKANMDEAVRSCLKYGYRLCLQQHKAAGLP